MTYNFFDKKSVGGAFENKLVSDQELAAELHKPITRKFQKHRLSLSFKGNTWEVDLAGMPLIIKYNK